MKHLRATLIVALGLADAAITITAACVALAWISLTDAEPQAELEPEPEPAADPDHWCPRCGVHRVRQDTYSGLPSFVALCPVCQPYKRAGA